MNEVTIYGASDDLIEVEGAIREEFNPRNDEMSYLAFSDGTVLSAEYGKGGIWHIRRVAQGTAEYERVESTDPESDYTDRVVLRGPGLSWIVFGSQIVRAIR